MDPIDRPRLRRGMLFAWLMLLLVGWSGPGR
jgi:hypothetical protein